MPSISQKLPFRPRDPQATKAGILAAARIEFSKAGFAGARVDRIAEQAGANKRMLYHYFGDKEGLFAAVVEDAYADIRNSEQRLRLDALEPREAIEKLVVFTWEYYLANPAFITLVNSENLYQARHIEGNARLRKLQRGYVDMVGAILRRGEEAGVFRPGVDPAQLCITIAAIGFYYLSNRHTSSMLFGFSFTGKRACAQRLAFNLETIRRLVFLDKA